jgi:hypothetical protein
MSGEDYIKIFQGKHAELSKLIRSWNLVAQSSADEFDKLAERILVLLDEGDDGTKTSRVIESQFCVTFGLFKWDFDAVLLTEEILLWWERADLK